MKNKKAIAEIIREFNKQAKAVTGLLENDDDVAFLFYQLYVNPSFTRNAIDLSHIDSHMEKAIAINEAANKKNMEYRERMAWVAAMTRIFLINIFGCTSEEAVQSIKCPEIKAITFDKSAFIKKVRAYQDDNCAAGDCHYLYGFTQDNFFPKE